MSGSEYLSSCILWTSPAYDTLSKAFSISNKIAMVECPVVNPSVIVSTTLISCMVVDRLSLNPNCSSGRVLSS